MSEQRQNPEMVIGEPGEGWLNHTQHSKIVDLRTRAPGGTTALTDESHAGGKEKPRMDPHFPNDPQCEAGGKRKIRMIQSQGPESRVILKLKRLIRHPRAAVQWDAESGREAWV